MKPGQGFDGLLITPLGIYIVEIKNGTYKWKFTASEQRLKNEVERLGHKYHVVQSASDARYIAGIV
jgi:hypothetical protein